MAAASVKLFWGVRNNVVAEIDDVTGARRLGISSAIDFHSAASVVDDIGSAAPNPSWRLGP